MTRTDILIIEDDDELRAVLTDFMEAEGFSVKGVPKAEEGIEYLETQLVRIIAANRQEMSFDTCVFVHLDWASQMALVLKNTPANAGDLRSANSISGSGRFPGKGNGNLLQYFCLENPMDRRAWRVIVHKVAMSQT